MNLLVHLNLVHRYIDKKILLIIKKAGEQKLGELDLDELFFSFFNFFGSPKSGSPNFGSPKSGSPNFGSPKFGKK